MLDMRQARQDLRLCWYAALIAGILCGGHSVQAQEVADALVVSPDSAAKFALAPTIAGLEGILGPQADKYIEAVETIHGALPPDSNLDLGLNKTKEGQAAINQTIDLLPNDSNGIFTCHLGTRTITVANAELCQYKKNSILPTPTWARACSYALAVAQLLEIVFIILLAAHQMRVEDKVTATVMA